MREPYDTRLSAAQPIKLLGKYTGKWQHEVPLPLGIGLRAQWGA
jgi:hypothetical protein